MAQMVTILSSAVPIGWLLWQWKKHLWPPAKCVRVNIRLDRDAPGAHLIWDVTNAADHVVTLQKLIVHGRHGATAAFPAGLPRLLQPEDRVLIPTDVDWSLLAAKSVAVIDDDGHEHVVSRAELANVQEHLRQLIDRRVYTASARDWLFGATDLAFGVVILGLGFFMLMWMIATS